MAAWMTSSLQDGLIPSRGPRKNRGGKRKGPPSWQGVMTQRMVCNDRRGPMSEVQSVRLDSCRRRAHSLRFAPSPKRQLNHLHTLHFTRWRLWAGWTRQTRRVSLGCCRKWREARFGPPHQTLRRTSRRRQACYSRGSPSRCEGR